MSFFNRFANFCTAGGRPLMSAVKLVIAARFFAGFLAVRFRVDFFLAIALFLDYSNSAFQVLLTPHVRLPRSCLANLPEGG